MFCVKFTLLSISLASQSNTQSYRDSLNGFNDYVLYTIATTLTDSERPIVNRTLIERLMERFPRVQFPTLPLPLGDHLLFDKFQDPINFVAPPQLLPPVPLPPVPPRPMPGPLRAEKMDQFLQFLTPPNDMMSFPIFDNMDKDLKESLSKGFPPDYCPPNQAAHQQRISTLQATFTKQKLRDNFTTYVSLLFKRTDPSRPIIQPTTISHLLTTNPLWNDLACYKGLLPIEEWEGYSFAAEMQQQLIQLFYPSISDSLRIYWTAFRSNREIHKPYYSRLILYCDGQGYATNIRLVANPIYSIQPTPRPSLCSPSSTKC